MNKQSVLVFGVGVLQQSIILRAKAMGLFVVGIDPCEDAACRDDVDAFEVVGGQDYELTLEVARKYGVSALVTAATDKPLVMMARVAEELGLNFFSEDTAIWSTDKIQMKRRFMEGGVPCAHGRLVGCAEDAQGLDFPVICKPRDNSGSRGVKLCRNMSELQICIDEALEHSRLDTVLVEEYIDGKEYSIEALHYNGRSEVIQFTEKRTTPFPYNVELGHIQPAGLSDEQKSMISDIICRTAECMNFENCPSHTELKINERGIFVIETSPRLGGDYITSTLTPLSTGINIEDQLLHISLGDDIDTVTGKTDKAAGVCFFSLPVGKITDISSQISEAPSWPDVESFHLSLKVGDRIGQITNSLNRYGHLIVAGEKAADIVEKIENYTQKLTNLITVADA